jgi:hypothetical protein
MTVAAGIETALEVWELTLPEEEAGCSWKQGGACKASATHAVVMRPCSHQRTYCEPHARRDEGAWLSLNQMIYVATCNACRGEIRNLTVIAI